MHKTKDHVYHFTLVNEKTNLPQIKTIAHAQQHRVEYSLISNVYNTIGYIYTLFIGECIIKEHEGDRVDKQGGKCLGCQSDIVNTKDNTV